MMLTPEQKGCLFIDCFPEIEGRRKQALYQRFGSGEAFLRGFAANGAEIAKIVGEPVYAKMKASLNPQFMNPIMEDIAEKGIQLIVRNDPLFPRSLLVAEDCPYMLYAIGDASLLSTPCISVVGAREVAVGQLSTVKQFSSCFARNGFTVVSGMALGSDAAAHEAALDAKGKTIAVLACGVDVIYPPQNRWLYDKIRRSGLIVSEYPPKAQAKPYRFLVRNRLVAALSEATLVTYARQKSGTRTTANYVVEYGRQLFVLPGDVGSEFSEGCNAMIKELQGTVALSPEGVLSAMGRTAIREESKPVSAPTKELLSYIHKQTHIEELIQKTGMTPSQLSVALFELEMAGLIERRAGNCYARIK